MLDIYAIDDKRLTIALESMNGINEEPMKENRLQYSGINNVIENIF